ncbi:MAG: TRAP transporter substrate-binding protein [Paracoccaceae bacterium]|nr:TRAP transporter substrate-binding protein [Paracoccaceae bacterium]
MKKLTIGLGAVLSTALLGTMSLAADKVLTVASWAAPFHTMNENVFPWMSSQLKSCTGGSLSLKVEYGMAPPPAMYDTVRDGVADMSWIVYGYTPGKFVTTMAAELPGIPGNARQKSVAFQRTHEKYFASVGEAKGVQILANYTHGPGMINTVKKVTSYKELKGVKMRIGGGVANAIGKALGVAGIGAPAPKVYELISGGVADGVFFPIETMHAFKIAELAKFSLDNPDGMYTTAFGIVMNNDAYEGLDTTQRGCVDSMRGVSLSRIIGWFWDDADKFGASAAASYGHELTIASDEERAYFTEVTSSVSTDIVAKISAAGVDGAAALAYFKEQVAIEAGK